MRLQQEQYVSSNERMSTYKPGFAVAIDVPVPPYKEYADSSFEIDAPATETQPALEETTPRQSYSALIADIER